MDAKTLAAHILAVPDLDIQSMEIPEWGSNGKALTVHVRGMNGAEYDDWQNAMSKAPVTLRHAISATFCLVDAGGGRIFGIDDAEALSKKSGKALDDVVDVFWRLNAIDDKTRAGKKKPSKGMGSSGTA